MTSKAMQRMRLKRKARAGRRRKRRLANHGTTPPLAVLFGVKAKEQQPAKA
jgi:hypothetical protein